MVYDFPLSDTLNLFHITHLEMLNIIVALKVRAITWAIKKIEINVAVVEVRTSGKSKDDFLAMCARKVWLITSILT